MSIRIKRIISVVSIALIFSIICTFSSIALSGTFGGGNSYTTFLSYSRASTTTAFAGGYGGTAVVDAEAAYHVPNQPLIVSLGKGRATNTAAAGGVNATVNLSAENPICTVGYYAKSTHSGTARNSSNTFTYSVNDKLP